MFIARAICGMTRARVAALCSGWSLQNILVTSIFEWSWTINECCNEETHNHDSRIPYLSLVTELCTVYTQSTPLHLTWGLLRVCAEYPTPRLNLRFDFRLPWNNITRYGYSSIAPVLILVVKKEKICSENVCEDPASLDSLFVCYQALLLYNWGAELYRMFQKEWPEFK